jgi:site-specific recombinase XerD
MGIGRMIERAGEAAGLPFPLHVHMLRHSTGFALAARGMDTRRLQHFLDGDVAGAVQRHLALISTYHRRGRLLP